MICVSCCVVCGKPTKQFVSSGRYAKYCSPECRSSESRVLHLAIAQVCATCGGVFHAERKKKYCSAECRLRAPRKTYRKMCELCHATFDTHTRKVRFCSASCAAQYNGAKKRFRQTEFTCIGCGKMFVRTRGSRDAKKYCSRECAFRHKATISPKQRKAMDRRKADKLLASSRPQTFVRRCSECGCSFIAKRINASVCSSRICYLARERRRWREYRINTIGRVRCFKCVRCGTTVEVDRFETKRNKYCVECAVAIDLERRRQYRRKANKLRRARMLSNGPHELIDSVKVFERDKWTCYMCGRRVDMWRGRMEAYTATLDHIVPLSLGGTHTLDNVRCACNECNYIKGQDS